MIDLQLFGGGGSTTTQSRNIPAQTGEEYTDQNNATNYANNAMNTSLKTLGYADYVAGNGGNAYNSYNNNASNINNGYQDLLNGNLPSQYAANRQQALNADLQGTVGNTISGLGNRGILNSTVTNGALNNISQNASNTLANDYSSDLSNYSGLLGNAASSNTSNLNNYEGLLSNLVGNSNSLSAPTNNLFNTMYSGRMGTAGTTQSTTGGNSTTGLVGTLGSAAIMCFIGGTKISTPNGDKNIEDIKLDDKVFSVDGKIETVIKVQKPQISPNEYVIVSTSTKNIKPTATQPFLTEEGFILPHELNGKKLIGFKENDIVVAVNHNSVKEIVYDFKTTGDNIYFADGFAVRGMH